MWLQIIIIIFLLWMYKYSGKIGYAIGDRIGAAIVKRRQARNPLVRCEMCHVFKPVPDFNLSKINMCDQCVLEIRRQRWLEQQNSPAAEHHPPGDPLIQCRICAVQKPQREFAMANYSICNQCFFDVYKDQPEQTGSVTQQKICTICGQTKLVSEFAQTNTSVCDQCFVAMCERERQE